MSEPSSDPDRHDPAHPDRPRRVVADWEYRTAYDCFFQIRMHSALHDRLCRWARQEGIPWTELALEILEREVGRRGGGSS